MSVDSSHIPPAPPTGSIALDAWLNLLRMAFGQIGLPVGANADLIYWGSNAWQLFNLYLHLHAGLSTGSGTAYQVTHVTSAVDSGGNQDGTTVMWTAHVDCGAGPTMALLSLPNTNGPLPLRYPNGKALRAGDLKFNDVVLTVLHNDSVGG